MAKFTENAKPRVLDHNVEGEKLVNILHKESAQAVTDKAYIKRNIKTVQQIERDRKVVKKNGESWIHRTGELPTYLINRKKEQEREYKEMLEQVERNKRPEGTVRLAIGEIKEIRENLN